MSASPQTTGARQRAIIPLHAVTYRPLDLTLDRHCRRPLDARCTLALFHGDQNEVNCFDARTRNITFGGLSVAGKLASPVQRDRPIEVAIDRPDGRKTHLAGVVAYCKPVERDLYEVGIIVKASALTSIITREVANARKQYAWFDSALDAPE